MQQGERIFPKVLAVHLSLCLKLACLGVLTVCLADSMGEHKQDHDKNDASHHQQQLLAS